MKKVILLLTMLFLSAGCSHSPIAIATPDNATSTTPTYNYDRRLQIGTQTLSVEVVSDAQKMQLGLSGRSSMSDNQGMLFDFGKTPLYPDFWMKDMKFNLDFIWINGDKVAGITPNIPAPPSNFSTEQLPLYSPPSPVTDVLEVNAGWSNAHNINVGEEVKLDP